MRPWARHVLLILCALALVSGSTMSLAASVAAENCAHNHSHAPGSQPHQHHDAGCLACCLGACVAVPGLPSRTALGAVSFSVTPVSYWEFGVSLSSRSIAPDPGPPRTSA
jgi:hypothetical protein